MKKLKAIIVLMLLCGGVVTFFWGASALYGVLSSIPEGGSIKSFALSPDVNLMNPFGIFNAKVDTPRLEKFYKVSWVFSGIVHLIVGCVFLLGKQKRPSLYGDAKFSSMKEIEDAGLFLNAPQALDKLSDEELKEKGLFAGDKIVVGKMGSRFIAMGGQQFVYLAAPTRSGKGVGVVIPVGLSYAHSIVVSDIKQELYQLTAPFRARCGHEIYLFDPFNVEGRTARWNPLTYVSRNHARRVDDLNQIALSLIPDSGGNDPFWETSARNLFLGIGLWLLDREEWESSHAVDFYKHKLKEWEKEQEFVRRAMAHNRRVNALLLWAEQEERKLTEDEAKNAMLVDIVDSEAFATKTDEQKNRFGIEYTDEQREEINNKRRCEGENELSFGFFIRSLEDGKNIPSIVCNSAKPEEPVNHPAPTIRAILDQCTAFKGDVQSHFYAMCNDVFTSDLTQQTLNSTISAPEQTFKSILSTLTSNLSLWLSEPVTNATSGDDFDLRDVRKRKMTIYLGIKPDDLTKAQKIINLFYSQLINENIRTLPQDDPTLKYQCLMLMDEGTAAGRITVLEKAVAYMAGFNMRLLFIAQSPAQLEDDKVYGEKGARTILSNIALKILYKTTDVKDSEEYSKLLGKITVKEDTSASRGGGNKGVSRTESTNQRDLMMPQEIREMDKSREIITFTDIKYPIMCDKIIYYTDNAFKHLKGHGKWRYQTLFERGIIKSEADRKNQLFLGEQVEFFYSQANRHVLEAVKKRMREVSEFNEDFHTNPAYVTTDY